MNTANGNIFNEDNCILSEEEAHKQRLEDKELDKIDIRPFLDRINKYGVWLNIPQEMRERKQWAIAGADKVPITILGFKAKVTDSHTWSTFEEAADYAFQRNLNIGYMLSKDDPFTIIDLDDKIDNPATEEQKERFNKIIEKFDSYTEKSVSGRGHHIVVSGKIGKGCRRGNVEIYSQERFIICTGNVQQSGPVNQRQEPLNELFRQVSVRADNHSVVIEDSPPTTDISDEQLINFICGSPSNKEHWNNTNPDDWSASFHSVLCAACKISDDQEQVNRVLLSSPLVQKSPPKAGETRVQKMLRRWKDEYPQAAAKGARYRAEQSIQAGHGALLAHSLLQPGSVAKQGGSLLDKIREFSLKGHAAKMREQMQNDVFVLDGLAILGQWTAFAAAPNSGKTLITLNLISQAVLNGDIDGEKVFYLNCDDTYNGSMKKVELAEKYGFHMLCNNMRGFDSNNLVDMLNNLSKSNEAIGTVFILDTLKKFTDLMDKKLQSNFYKIARAYVASGGTLICLSHVNKNKDSSGKSVRSGTSDLMDDCDCFYIIEREDAGDKALARFRNEKARGDVDQEAVYSFTTAKDSYENLFDSVCKEGDMDAFNRHVEEKIDEQHIAAITSYLKQASESIRVDALKRWCIEQNKISFRQFDRVLKRWDGVHWYEFRGNKNSRMISILKSN